MLSYAILLLDLNNDRHRGHRRASPLTSTWPWPRQPGCLAELLSISAAQDTASTERQKCVYLSNCCCEGSSLNRNVFVTHASKMFIQDIKKHSAKHYAIDARTEEAAG